MTTINEIAAAECARLADGEDKSRHPWPPNAFLGAAGPAYHAFRDRVIAFSEAAKAAHKALGYTRGEDAQKSAQALLTPFILPEPVDTLVEALEQTRKQAALADPADFANVFRAALDRAGLEIREKRP